MLVHSGSKPVETSEVKKCQDPRCKCCPHVEEKEDFEINGKKHKVINGGTCKSENIIYGMRCKVCNSWYIGESGLKLPNCLNGHRASIKRLEKGEKLNTQLNDT
jgi:hypothetical protein